MKLTELKELNEMDLQNTSENDIKKSFNSIVKKMREVLDANEAEQYINTLHQMYDAISKRQPQEQIGRGGNADGTHQIPRDLGQVGRGGNASAARIKKDNMRNSNRNTPPR